MANPEVLRVQQYKANLMVLYQQGPSVLKGAVREEVVNAKQAFFDRVGPTATVKRTTRHGDTPLVETQFSRRMVNMADYEWADLTDDQDKIRLLVDPTSVYAVNAAKAFNRTYDDVVIAAFAADAAAGEDGSTAVTFASEDLGDHDFTAAALDNEDLLTMKLAMDNLEIPEEGRHILLPPVAVNQLLKDTKISSSDFNTIKALVKGDIDSYLGFKFHRSTRLPIPSANQLSGFYWHEDAMGIAIGAEQKVEIGPRPDKSYATQVYVSMTMGATRIQNGVGRFKVDITR